MVLCRLLSRRLPPVLGVRVSYVNAASRDQRIRDSAVAAAASKASAAAAVSKAPAAAVQPAPAAAKQQHQQQCQQLPTTPGHILHTPLRVRVQGSSTAAAGPPAARSAVPGQAVSSVARPGAVAPPLQGATTPPMQQVNAFGNDSAAGQPMAARAVTPPRAAVRAVVPVVPGSSADAAASAAVALLSPRLAAMGSARRVVPTQARTAGVAPTAAGAAGSSVAQAATGSAGAPGAAATAMAGPPATPLHKPARRTVDDQHVDEEDKRLEALVERCLRIANPGASLYDSRWFTSYHALGSSRISEPGMQHCACAMQQLWWPLLLTSLCYQLQPVRCPVVDSTK